MRRVACLALLLAAGCGGSGEYPNRSITVVCPWSPGGGTDTVSRQFAHLLSKDVGVAVNVVNATGGQGVTGHSRGAYARPDGYTIMMMTVELNMLHWRGLTQVTHEDFLPVALLNRDAAALFVRKDSPWASLKDLEAHVKSAPERLRASGTAQGGIWHLALAGWYSAIGRDPGELNWLSTGGAGPSMAELLAGGLDAVCCSLPEARSQLEGGEVRCLGVMSDERVAGFESVPTFREQGFEWSLGGWRALGIPRETPAPVARRVTEAVARVVKGDAFKGELAKLGFNWTYEGPEAARASLRKDDEALGRLLTSDAFEGIRRGRFGLMIFPAVLGGAFLLVVIALGATGGLRLEKAEGTGGGWGRAAECVVGTALFVAFLEPVGFVLSAGVLLGGLLWRLGTKPAWAVGVAVVLVPVVYQLFTAAMGVPLPRGILGW